VQQPLLSILFVFFSFLTFAQDFSGLNFPEDQGAPEKVIGTFKSTKVINAQTNETLKKRLLNFHITHRFGNIGSQSGGAHTLWGLDNATNIRFAFDYGITDRLQAGIGRSKTREHIDTNLKYKLTEQSENLSMPVSVTLFGIMALTPERDPTNRYSKITDRTSFVSQAIIARKFSDRLSLALLPTLTYRIRTELFYNMYNSSFDENLFFSQGFAGRLKLTSRTVLVADYFFNFSPYRTNNPSRPHFNPLAVGVEIETGGHVFHINITNTAGIIENDFLPYTRDSWKAGEIKLGFNISRVFIF
jgi:hypothetical protein